MRCSSSWHRAAGKASLRNLFLRSRKGQKSMLQHKDWQQDYRSFSVCAGGFLSPENKIWFCVVPIKMLTGEKKNKKQKEQRILFEVKFFTLTELAQQTVLHPRQHLCLTWRRSQCLQRLNGAVIPIHLHIHAVISINKAVCFLFFKVSQTIIHVSSDQRFVHLYDLRSQTQSTLYNSFHCSLRNDSTF